MIATNNDDRFALSYDENALREALASKGCRVTGKSCTCPWHEDRNPSASILEGQDGKWRVVCHTASCGRTGDIYDVTDTQPAQDAPRWAGNGPRIESKAPAVVQAPPRVYDSSESLLAAFPGNEGFYKYTNPATGDVDMIIVRYRRGDRKAFAQHRPLPGGRWEAKCPEGPLPLFNRKGIADSTGPVVVVEGEKCVYALHQAGLVGTTSSGGAGKAAKTDWSPLAGRTCILWPDNDPVDPKTGKSTGIEHMREVQAILATLRPRPEVRWIDPATTGLPPKGDVADLVGDLTMAPLEARKAAVEKVLATAKADSIVQDLLDDNQDIVDGKGAAIPWPWRILSEMTEAIAPGNIVIIYGGPGSGKSFMLLQCLVHWHQQGIPVACYMLESSKKTHMRRAIAQLDGSPGYPSRTWISENKEAADLITQRWADFANGFQHCLFARTTKTISGSALLTWAEEQAKRGSRVIAIDPISIAQSTDKPWEDSKDLISGLESLATTYGCTMLLVNHPTKGTARNKKSGEAVMSGGAALSNYSQVVLHLSKEMDSADDTRLIFIEKAREGIGQYMTLKYEFSRRNLTFVEQGPVTRTPAPATIPKMARPQRSMPPDASPSEDLFTSP